ncbi:MAG: hypothetical protein H5T43_10420 [Methanomethylovorans sp.]|nr:hypothetical protein [Methanomethylovorans sp.]
MPSLIHEENDKSAIGMCAFFVHVLFYMLVFIESVFQFYHSSGLRCYLFIYYSHIPIVSQTQRVTGKGYIAQQLKTGKNRKQRGKPT